MSDEAKLIEAIKKIASEAWEARAQPVLLSSLPPLLAANLPEFKELLAGKSLKAFIESTGEAGGYQALRHPHQSSKVGVLPSTATYVFPDPPEPAVSEQKAHPDGGASRAATLAFLQSVGGLSPEEQAEVHIPLPILVKLLSK